MNFTQFSATKKLFMPTFVGVTFPLTYTEWLSLEDDLKAAALYINFYSEIILSWTKFTRYVVSDDIAVSWVMQTLIRNVPKIVENPKRFYAGYIYRISWNAIGDAMKTKMANNIYDYEMSNILTDMDSGEELNLYDLVPYEDEPYEVATAREAMWEIIRGMGPKAVKVANHIISGESLNSTHRKTTSNAVSEVSNVSVSSDEYSIILEQFKQKLSPLWYAFR